MKKEELREAREVLIRHGVLLRFSDMQLFHGRINDDSSGEEWRVDPKFDNSGNLTSHHNINKIASLSVGDFFVAKDFAEARLKKKARFEDVDNLSAKVYRIASLDSEAVIVNNNFSFEDLSEFDKFEVKKAIRTIKSFGISEGVPYRFEERDLHEFIADRAKSYLARSGENLFSREAVDAVYDRIKQEMPRVRRELVYDVLSAYNTRVLIGYPDFLRKVVVNFVELSDRGALNVYGYPINGDYISAWAANNHIVGCLMTVDSATLNKRIDMCSLFDLEKINTQKAIGEKYQQIMDCFGDIAELVDRFRLSSKMCDFLKESTPEETMQKFRESKTIDGLFKADAGNWEGFTVGEHTETVLRIFEETYQKDVPEKLLPFIKIALASHDIGKGQRFGDYGLNQKSLNVNYAKVFYDKLKIPAKVQEMLLFVIGESQKYTTDYYVYKNKNAINELRLNVEDMLSSTLRRSVTSGEVDGFVEICKMLQTCDSGAYTRYAITRKEGTSKYYYNGNDRFTKGFENPNGLNKRSLTMREPE